MADNKSRPGRAHKETTREAGFGSMSVISILAGTLCAYGGFALVAALAGALLNRADVDTEFRTNDWTGSGAVAALVSALVLLLAYLFGGYVAGRMARRRGGLHGLAVAILSLVLGAIIGAVVGGLSDNADVEDNLRSIGVPTTTDQITGVAVAGVLASLAAIIVGAIIGGVLGERWHSKLARRAADPDVGPAAESRGRAGRDDNESAHRREQDEGVRHAVHTPNDRRAEPNGTDDPTWSSAGDGRRTGEQAGASIPHNADDDSGDEDERLTAAEWRQRESGPRQGSSASNYPGP